MLRANITLCIAYFCLSIQAVAAERLVSSNEALESVLAESNTGDHITLAAGTFSGPITIKKSIQLTGTAKTIIDSNGSGSGLIIAAPNVTVKNLTIQNWGDDLYEHNSGVKLNKGANNTTLSYLTLKGTGYGISGENLENVNISHCDITGNAEYYYLDRGDGIRFKYVKNPIITHTKIQTVRDGIYFENTDKSQISESIFSDLQYGIHYMYTRDDSAQKNHVYNVEGGYALMSSERINLAENSVENAWDFGILLNVTNDSEIKNNLVTDIKNPEGDPLLTTEGKGLFIYGAKNNRIYGNTLINSDTGINVALGGEGNKVWQNNISDNQTQARYVGTESQEWSFKGQGNYWGTYQGWDLNGDQIGDTPYQPNDSLDRLFWLYPNARQLMDSPVVSLLRWVNQQLALDQGVGITDSFPLMIAPPKLKPIHVIKDNSYAQH